MKFFTIAELCKSTTADRLGINNRCRQEHVTALTALVDNVLDPLRTWWGKPITVNSGYRCPELNAAVKGSKTSQHMSGQAADIDTGDRQQNKLLFEHIRKNLPFDQLIDEAILHGCTSVIGLTEITGCKFLSCRLCWLEL